MLAIILELENDCGRNDFFRQLVEKDEMDKKLNITDNGTFVFEFIPAVNFGKLHFDNIIVNKLISRVSACEMLF